MGAWGQDAVASLVAQEGQVDQAVLEAALEAFHEGLAAQMGLMDLAGLESQERVDHRPVREVQEVLGEDLEVPVVLAVPRAAVLERCRVVLEALVLEDLAVDLVQEG